MVLHKSKYLHEELLVSYQKGLEYTVSTRQEIMEEVKRWEGILSVSYANYNLENNRALQPYL